MSLIRRRRPLADRIPLQYTSEAYAFELVYGSAWRASAAIHRLKFYFSAGGDLVGVQMTYRVNSDDNTDVEFCVSGSEGPEMREVSLSTNFGETIQEVAFYIPQSSIRGIVLRTSRHTVHRIAVQPSDIPHSRHTFFSFSHFQFFRAPASGHVCGFQWGLSNDRLRIVSARAIANDSVPEDFDTASTVATPLRDAQFPDGEQVPERAVAAVTNEASRNSDEALNIRPWRARCADWMDPFWAGMSIGGASGKIPALDLCMALPKAARREPFAVGTVVRILLDVMFFIAATVAGGALAAGVIVYIESQREIDDVLPSMKDNVVIVCVVALCSVGVFLLAWRIFVALTGCLERSNRHPLQIRGTRLISLSFLPFLVGFVIVGIASYEFVGRCCLLRQQGEANWSPWLTVEDLGNTTLVGEYFALRLLDAKVAYNFTTTLEFKSSQCSGDTADCFRRLTIAPLVNSTTTCTETSCPRVNAVVIHNEYVDIPPAWPTPGGSIFRTTCMDEFESDVVKEGIQSFRNLGVDFSPNALIGLYVTNMAETFQENVDELNYEARLYSFICVILGAAVGLLWPRDDVAMMS